MSPECQNLRQDFEALSALKRQFDAAFDEAVASGDVGEAKKLKGELEAGMAALREKIIPPEIMELHLREQYDSQRNMLEKVGILENLFSGEKGIKGIDGKEYPIPSYEAVLARMKERKETVKAKKPQGFEKLLLVPFGMSLDLLMEKYRAVILDHHKNGKLLATKKSPQDADTLLELDENQPLYVWDKLKGGDTNGNIVYAPKAFGAANHGGKTKAELLVQTEAEKNVWQILLLEDLPNLPGENQGKTLAGRTQIEANRSANDILSTLGKTGTPYADESGMTPEGWLTLAITHLEKTDQVIDDWDGNGKGSILAGTYVPSSDYVPGADWNRDDRRAYLSGFRPGDGLVYFTVRGAVRV